MANRQLNRVILERLFPPSAGVPGPVVARQDIRDAVDAFKPGYKDVFRRLRELQGEEGLTGIIKFGSRYQLVSLAVGPKREPRKAAASGQALDVALRQGNRCAVCGTPIGAEGPTRAELDHRVPRVRGGDNREENLQGLCGACNNAKSTQCTNCTLDCYTCGWAFPETYRPVKLRPDIILRLNMRAKGANQDVDQMANALLERALRD
jgi:5-methylcytosine-specific restriction endonuclease McrA